jgi:hypothetical protein
MITLYHASTSIDANIVQDILALEDIKSHIMGSFLEGAIGEIQPQGIIKLMGREEDYQAARKIITEWEKG